VDINSIGKEILGVKKGGTYLKLGAQCEGFKRAESTMRTSI
jgi:hypothetical protein